MHIQHQRRISLTTRKNHVVDHETYTVKKREYTLSFPSLPIAIAKKTHSYLPPL